MQSAMTLCDFYKLSHRAQYPEGTEEIYSTFTPRASRMEGVDKVVFFGLQGFINEFLVNFFNKNFFGKSLEDVLDEYTRIIRNTLGDPHPDTEHIEYLWNLKYLPLEIKALPEGTHVPLRVPMFTVRNTDDECFWLTNYIETMISAEVWHPCTSATIANQYKQLLTHFAKETDDNKDFVPFQGHDFSMRGMTGVHAAMKSGAGHLLSFVGTDTIPAVHWLEEHYAANVENELVGTSIPATEHSVQCAYGNDLEYIRRMITEVYPSGMVSIVCDGYDFWHVIAELLPELKDEIMARDGKVVIRPDSGDPVKIITGDPDSDDAYIRQGAVECLYDIFGGKTNDKGYINLDSHIGLIYGDAITLERCERICSRLKEEKFASTNVVYGIGSYTYQYVTRDTFGFAMKSTNCVINGVSKPIFKDPKTDDGTKKSQKGFVIVDYDDKGDLIALDEMPRETEGLMKSVFYNGTISYRQSLKEIRARVAEG